MRKLRAHGHEQGARAGRARDSLAPSAAAQQESAAVLGHDVPDFLRIRKTNHTPPKRSVYAAIMPIKKCNVANASQELTRHHERHGDRFTNCESVNFPAGAQTESGTETYLHKPMCGTEESTTTQLRKPSRGTEERTETVTHLHKSICGADKSMLRINAC